jgi:hypothetical protein
MTDARRCGESSGTGAGDTPSRASRVRSVRCEEGDQVPGAGEWLPPRGAALMRTQLIKARRWSIRHRQSLGSESLKQKN